VGADALDADALATLGIDLDAVRSTVEASFGPGALDPRPGRGKRRLQSGHIPFSGRAKKVLELALRECLARKDVSITDAHIMLGLIREGQGLAVKVITDRGIDLERLRREIGSQPAA
jgi:ATP-dependent Clp protease ATP-binding subunit ClpA